MSLPRSASFAGFTRPLAGAVALAFLLPFAGCDHGSPSQPAPLTTPELVSITSSDGIASLQWNAVPRAKTYEVYWSTAAILDLTTANHALGITDVSFTVTGLVNGDTYYFLVRAVAGPRLSSLSTVAQRTLAPDVADAVSITAGDGFVELTWDAVHGAASYDVYRSTSPGVSKETADVFHVEASPFHDTTVANGTTYYYCVVAVGGGGESEQSAEVSARPAVALGAPETPMVTLVEEQPQTLVVSWLPPTIGNPESYNLYWSTAPGVTVGSNAILDVTSPYVHSGLLGKTTYYYVVTAVERGAESVPSVEVSGTPKGGQGGGHTSTFGNNLSFPLLFADGIGVAGAPLDGTVSPWLDYATGLRPTTTDVVDPFPSFESKTAVMLNRTTYFPQQSPSTWQADWRDGSQQRQDVIVDWGDNLSSAHLSASSVIRVETTLYQDTSTSNPTDTMTAYSMTLLGGSGQSEVYGTDGSTYESNQWSVFACNAHLRIEKLTGQGGAVDPSVPGFDATVYEHFGAEEGGYGAEVNSAGKLVYGYVWMLKTWPLTTAQKQGWWRLTFSLDPQATFGTPATTVENNTFLTQLDPSETIATLDTETNSSSIEIELQ